MGSVILLLLTNNRRRYVLSLNSQINYVHKIESHDPENFRTNKLRNIVYGLHFTCFLPQPTLNVEKVSSALLATLSILGN